MKYSKDEQKPLIVLTKEVLKKEVNDVEELIRVLNFHEYKYYIENNPVITDAEYDIIFHQLKALEKNPNNLRPYSPTQRVSSDLNEGFTTVKHLTPMLSLDNAYNAEDLQEFDKQLRKLLGDVVFQYTIEPKFDGGSIALVYENDLLVRAATRGNGQEGDDITANAKAIRSIPLKAAFSKYNISKAELRGETVIHKSIFDKKNKEREKAGQSVFANARNAATGGLRMKDPSEVAERGLETFIFQIALAIDKDGKDVLSSFASHFKSLDILAALGFKVANKERKLCKTIQEVAEFADSWQGKREGYDYEIDGMVVKLDDFDLQERCGMTSHHPRWATAFKFKAKQATTTLENVEYQVGKVGSITPVAKVSPVHLAGVTISSISLHNEEFILQKDLHIGDTVLIERAGDVIPYIVKAIPEARTGKEVKIKFPEYCPINLSEKIALIQAEGEAAWRCPSCSCGAQDLQRMIFHVSKDAMDIDGFGKSNVERFQTEGWLNDISDIYNLNYEAIADLDGFGQRSADKIQASIEKAKSNPLHKILYSLSIHHFGKKASKLIAQEISHIKDLTKWQIEDFTDIKDIGPVVADNVIDWFAQEKNLAMLDRMEQYGMDMTQKEADMPSQVDADAVFAGKTILFTGTLKQMGRKEAQTLAEKHGAKNMSAVSKNLNILVAGEKAGSKLKKAEALGTVEVISEEEFVKRISD